MEETPSQKPVESKPPTSLFSRLFPKLSFISSLQSALLPLSVVLCVIFLGGGGTYIVALSLTQPKAPPPKSISKISSIDLIVATPTLSPPPTDEPAPTASPSAITAQAQNLLGDWIHYTFFAVSMKFQYPKYWVVNLGQTSGAPFLHVYNAQSKYSIYISRLDQVGITTINALATQLALSAANDVYINSVNVGKTTIIASSSKTVNGYSALERTISYSSSPSAQLYELYVLDGKSNAIKFMPEQDTKGTMPYLNALVTTIKFTN